MRNLLMLVVVMMLFSACGVKGPLYLPEKRYPQSPTTPAKPVQTETKSQ
jgi:predicted small lipoprotein YifL